MGIDINAIWPELADAEVASARDAWATESGGFAGYIREGYHGGPYPSQHLVREAFNNAQGVAIKSSTLRTRLPETLRLAKERCRRVYNVTDAAEIKREFKQYRDFVAFCQAVEADSGVPPHVVASW